MTNDDRFFVAERIDFFSPLAGKFREISAGCIKNLYLRLNGPEADYSYNLNRQDVIDIFIQSIRDNPVLIESELIEQELIEPGLIEPGLIEPGLIDPELIESEFAQTQPDPRGRSRMHAANPKRDPDKGSSSSPPLASINIEKQARDSYQRLKKYGWIEEYMDPGMMETAIRFTTFGRQFAIPFAQSHTEIITNTQHTRSTLSHLQTFMSRLNDNTISIGDLMIATKLAFEIISDFNELIEALVEKRRELMASVNREIQEAKKAGESFFDFMQKRFMPDIRFRFSADSVERYRHEILEIIGQIRLLPDQTKRHIEIEIRQSHPTLIREDRPVLLFWALDQIEHHVATACDVKLPELRTETENFVRRAQALITHIATLSFGEIDTESIFNIATRFGELSSEDIDAVFQLPQARFGRMDIALYNPAKITPPIATKKDTVDTHFATVQEMDSAARREAYIRYQLERTFAVESGKISDQIIKQLAGGKRIKAAHLKITDVSSFLAAIHAPQLASVSAGAKPCFRIIPSSQAVDNEYYHGDGFELEYISPQE